MRSEELEAGGRAAPGGAGAASTRCARKVLEFAPRPSLLTPHPKGFTLIELVVTVAILGILAAGALPLMQLAAQRSKETELRVALRQIRGALDAYKTAAEAKKIEKPEGSSGYPPTLEVLVQGVPDITDPKGRPIYFLRRLPRDPFEADASLPAARTWALRSYASPPDTPQPGDDVFDVASRATGVGLNGVPYREW